MMRSGSPQGASLSAKIMLHFGAIFSCIPISGPFLHSIPHPSPLSFPTSPPSHITLPLSLWLLTTLLFRNSFFVVFVSPAE